MDKVSTTAQYRRKATIAFSLATIAAVVSVFELHRWHIYIGMAVVLVAFVFGFMSFGKKMQR
jgi:hypothetical protein